MKIAISSDSGNVSGHFGRAPTYTFITIENNKVVKKEEFPNPGHTVGSIPDFVHKQGAQYMISGGMGHRAIGFFNQYGIEVIVGVQGKIDDVIKRILSGEIKNLGGESLCEPGGGKGYGVDKIHTEADDDFKHHHHQNF
ncbi:MAG: NifB/NifX family molybdenum-iron cluster-binding protein [Candidatus Thorarchaeota archaeon]